MPVCIGPNYNGPNWSLQNLVECKPALRLEKRETYRQRNNYCMMFLIFLAFWGVANSWTVMEKNVYSLSKVLGEFCRGHFLGSLTMAMTFFVLSWIPESKLNFIFIPCYRGQFCALICQISKMQFWTKQFVYKIVTNPCTCHNVSPIFWIFNLYSGC